MSHDEESSSESEYETAIDLGNKIEKITSSGSFAVFQSYTLLPLFNVDIEDFGSIYFPIHPDTAQRLIEISSAAPFGKGSQTIIDQTVRKTWEIDGHKVSFNGEAWPSFFDEIRLKACLELGIEDKSQISAIPDKLLLYETGGFFKSHKDSEKITGTIGTLALTLPSFHEGGTMSFVHGNENKTFSTSHGSASAVGVMAWYPDVSHEISLVTAGVRVVLTFKLVDKSNGIKQSATILSRKREVLVSTLEDLTELNEDLFIWRLEHLYTPQGLRKEFLKGNDKPRVREIEEASKVKKTFVVLLATMEKVRSYVPGESEELETELTLTNVFDCDGHQLSVSELRILKQCFLQKHMYKGRSPTTQTGGDYLGNQHDEICKSYKDSVMIIYTYGKLASFLVPTDSPATDLVKFLKLLRQRPKKQHQLPDSQEVIKQLCHTYLHTEYSDSNDRDRHMGPVALGAYLLEDESTFEVAIEKVKLSFDSDTYEAFGQFYQSDTAEVSDFSIAHLLKIFSPIRRLDLLRNSIESFERGSEAAMSGPLADLDQHLHISKTQLRRFERQFTLQQLRSSTKIKLAEVPAIVEIVENFEDNEVFAEISKLTTRFNEIPEFANLLATHILKRDSVGHHLGILLDLVSRTVAKKLHLSRFLSMRPLSAKLLGLLYKRFINGSNPDLASSLREQILDQMKSMSVEQLSEIHNTLWKEMASVLDLSFKVNREFLRDIIKNFAKKKVGDEPQPPADFARPKSVVKQYSAQDRMTFEKFNRFLLDPHEETVEFTKNEFKALGDFGWHRDWEKVEEVGEEVVSNRVRVMKTKARWEETHKAWEKALSSLSENLKDLPRERLRQALGDEYQNIRDLQFLRKEYGPPQKRRKLRE